MSGFRSLAVLGGLGGTGPTSGAFGPHLVKALRDEGAHVIIPVRASPVSDP